MGVISGVILDESILLTEGEDKNGFILRREAEFLIRTLSLSKTHIGISYEVDYPDDKVSVLQRIACLYSLDCFILNDPASHVMPAWSIITDGGIVYLVSNKKEFLPKLSSYKWLLVVLNDGDESSYYTTDVLQIQNLVEFPLTMCQLNKSSMGTKAVTVGYLMKPSRMEDFAKRGAFPLCPTQNGLMFVALRPMLPLSTQLKDVDIVLHKATDEILSIEDDKITFRENIQELQGYLELHQDLCGRQPFDQRGHFLIVNNFEEFNVETRLAEARLSLSCIVKPQAACGVSDAHKMAIVFRVDDFKSVGVPLPAVMHEYVGHSSTLYKFYVLGEEIFHAVKKSIPNADVLKKSSNGNELKPLEFDSLKSLPIGDFSVTRRESIDIKLVIDAANWLRRRLQLTIFGFDVVIQEGTRDHVIVDVNYLPSFKEVLDDISIPAF
ncbi:hypothetical protein PIB30_056436 [Stylosanthes scabra]|uniref:inositol-1,3,4-trisphosphate 5/6-kinase n=1 Tax=Stylosanthes scabra TaxID=79078 RepID=A0ABU6UI52_9FABA|nr:hypothetical protein [Stylosanthes scabra]